MEGCHCGRVQRSPENRSFENAQIFRFPDVFCCLVLVFFSPLCRIKLKKAKSIREKMKEAGVLEDFLKKIKYDPAKKYHFSDDYVVYEPMTSHLDVSTPRFPSRCLSVRHAPLSLLLPSCQSNLFTPEPPGVTDSFLSTLF